MAIPAGAIRITLVGHLTDGEVFNTSLWASNNASLGDLDTEVEADAYATDISTVFTSSGLLGALKPLLTTDSGYDEVRVYSYPAGGPTASVIGSAAVASGAGTGTTPHPLQTAWVASLRSDFSGRSRRGRMYFPQTGAVIDSGHEMSSTACNAHATNVAAFIVAVSGIARTGEVIILSQKAAGAAVPITSVVVNSRLDVQRRRANRQVANVNFTAPVNQV